MPPPCESVVGPFEIGGTLEPANAVEGVVAFGFALPGAFNVLTEVVMEPVTNVLELPVPVELLPVELACGS